MRICSFNTYPRHHLLPPGSNSFENSSFSSSSFCKLQPFVLCDLFIKCVYIHTLINISNIYWNSMLVLVISINSLGKWPLTLRPIPSAGCCGGCVQTCLQPSCGKMLDLKPHDLTNLPRKTFQSRIAYSQNSTRRLLPGFLFPTCPFMPPPCSPPASTVVSSPRLWAYSQCIPLHRGLQSGWAHHRKYPRNPRSVRRKC